MAYLEIKNFTKSFGQTEVLKGVSVSVEKGQVVSIIGSSGSGKTTLLRCLNFLETPDLGEMTLDGKVLISDDPFIKNDEKSLREKRLNFGLVFQSFNLFPQYSVLKNITIAPQLLINDKLKEYKNRITEQLKKADSINESATAYQRKEKLFATKKAKAMIKAFKQNEEKRIEEDAKELLKKIGLEDKAQAYPCELSGGQCQRVAIARALALKPKILCFDEPTSALDPELTGEVLKVIRGLKEKDRTMIIVTHEMGFAKNVSDKIVFLSDGVVEEEGDPKEVMENPKSEKLIQFLSSVSQKDGE